MSAVLRAALAWLRGWSGDSAYESYLESARRGGVAAPMSREDFYLDSLRRRYSPRRLLARLQRVSRDWERFACALPRDLSDILERIRKGTFEIKHEHERLEVSVNRLVLGLLSASFFLGGTIMLTRESPELPGLVLVLLGLGSMAGAIALAVRLAMSIRRMEKEEQQNRHLGHH